MIPVPVCKSCKAKINLILTSEGKTVPVDTEEICISPNNKGNVIVAKLDGEIIRGTLAMKGSQGAIAGHTIHFETCRKSR